MRDLAVLAFVTLDGVMQAPSSPDEDRTGAFDLGGWASPYWNDVMPHVESTAMSEPYDILFGRKTMICLLLIGRTQGSPWHQND